MNQWNFSADAIARIPSSSHHLSVTLQQLSRPGLAKLALPFQANLSKNSTTSARDLAWILKNLLDAPDSDELLSFIPCNPGSHPASNYDRIILRNKGFWFYLFLPDEYKVASPEKQEEVVCANMQLFTKIGWIPLEFSDPVHEYPGASWSSAIPCNFLSVYPPPKRETVSEAHFNMPIRFLRGEELNTRLEQGGDVALINDLLSHALRDETSALAVAARGFIFSNDWNVLWYCSLLNDSALNEKNFLSDANDWCRLEYGVYSNIHNFAFFQQQTELACIDDPYKLWKLYVKKGYLPTIARTLPQLFTSTGYNSNFSQFVKCLEPLLSHQTHIIEFDQIVQHVAVAGVDPFEALSVALYEVYKGLYKLRGVYGQPSSSFDPMKKDLHIIYVADFFFENVLKYWSISLRGNKLRFSAVTWDKIFAASGWVLAYPLSVEHHVTHGLGAGQVHTAGRAYAYSGTMATLHTHEIAYLRNSFNILRNTLLLTTLENTPVSFDSLIQHIDDVSRAYAKSVYGGKTDTHRPTASSIGICGLSQLRVIPCSPEIVAEVRYVNFPQLAVNFPMAYTAIRVIMKQAILDSAYLREILKHVHLYDFVLGDYGVGQWYTFDAPTNDAVKRIPTTSTHDPRCPPTEALANAWKDHQHWNVLLRFLRT
jgi:hypothetical protein